MDESERNLMKKILTIMLVFSLVLSSVTVSANNDNNIKKIKTFDVVTNEENLEKMMNKSDKDSKDVFKIDSVVEIKIDDDANKYATRVKEYKSLSQKVKEVEFENGKKETEYVSDALVTLEFTDEFFDVSGYGNSNSIAMWDSGYNAKIRLHVSWIQCEVTDGLDKGTSYRITGVKAKYDSLASSIYPYSLRVGAQSHGRKYTDMHCTNYVGTFNRNLNDLFYASSVNLLSYRSLRSFKLDPYYTFVIQPIGSYAKGYVYGEIKRGINGSPWLLSPVEIKFD
ncbi:hypothetical protein [Petrocella sp. FN5]|uniref:hypothetical protein n=1 Tax=Petrocella sp. FN5 TaxID=3032002 RepID=UPI0023DBE6CE|nr:hypothetical protein [Petrocella sp. FN5]MDF1618750.1 hypothetical protein [Petrocella sp. FN5]